MKAVKTLLFAFALTIGALTAGVAPAFAGDTDPLVIKIINDDAHRIHGALMWAGLMAKAGHPVTILVSDHAVRIAAKDRAGNLTDHQAMLTDLLKQKVAIVICPMCMKEFGYNESDLIPGMTLGDPDVMAKAIFKDNTKVITW
jgi:intracellular sulfur oxidation DsrE/DsrF family protein